MKYDNMILKYVDNGWIGCQLVEYNYVRFITSSSKHPNINMLASPLNCTGIRFKQSQKGKERKFKKRKKRKIYENPLPHNLHCSIPYYIGYITDMFPTYPVHGSFLCIHF